MSHFFDILFWQYFSFFMSLFIAEVICSHSFSCKVSQCVCSLWFFCVGTWLFQPLDYYCLMLLWLQTIPRNKKKKCCSQTFWMLDCGWLSLNSCCGVKIGEDVARRWRSKPSTPKIVHRTIISHPFSITSKISFYTKKWYHFHSNEVQSRAAQRCHLPIDHYANSYTVHRCNKRSRDGWRKHLLEGPESSKEQRNGFGFL